MKISYGCCCFLSNCCNAFRFFNLTIAIRFHDDTCMLSSFTFSRFLVLVISSRLLTCAIAKYMCMLSFCTDPVNSVSQCGSVINNTLKSPGYPNDYPSDMDCTYTVPIPHNMTMNITFIHFELEDHRLCP